MELAIYTIKNYPLCKLELPGEATVKDVKLQIAKKCRISSDRQSLKSEIKGKSLKDDLKLSEIEFKEVNKLYLKDLGLQIGWKTVFILEYLGPLVIYPLIATRPRLLYIEVYPKYYSKAALFALACWSSHYIKRLLETQFVHRFSHSTMPLKNLFRNCCYYWLAAAYVSYHVNHPFYIPPSPTVTLVGLITFIVCEIGNLSVHLLMRNLRPKGTGVRKVPFPNGNFFTKLFNLVSCPNYTYEFGAWVGFALMTGCVPAWIFSFIGLYQMSIWALQKNKTYKDEFKEYPNRKAILPFIL